MPDAYPWPPSDLKAGKLRQRLQTVCVPRYLVDAGVEATWQADAGFDYEVVSHEEHFDDSRKRWATREVIEPRIRWEPRLGKLDRRYDNIVAPALDEDPEIRGTLGAFDSKAVERFRADAVDRALVRLPNRSPADAWPDAEPGFRHAATAECQETARADHIRDFRWSPRFKEKNWTQLLLPVYSTFYLDDDNVPRPVLIHGQSGQVCGIRRASMKRARRIAMVLFILALIAFIGGVAFATMGFLLPHGGLQSFGIMGIITGMLVAIAGIAPPALAWGFNYSQRQQTQLF